MTVGWKEIMYAIIRSTNDSETYYPKQKWRRTTRTLRVVDKAGFATQLQREFELPSVLWRCRLGGRKGIRPVKTEWWGAGVVRPICLERVADLHIAQLMPLPLTVSYFSKIQIGFTFLVPAYPGSPGKKAVKRVCVTASVYCRRRTLVFDTRNHL